MTEKQETWKNREKKLATNESKEYDARKERITKRMEETEKQEVWKQR